MRRDYKHDALPGFAFQRAAEERATFWGALRQEIGHGRFYAGLIVGAAALAFIVIAAAVLA